MASNRAQVESREVRLPDSGPISLDEQDKDGVKPEQVMQELLSIGLMLEDWGGDIPMVQISALKGENVDDLLEIVMLVAELQELKSNPHGNAKGTVIDAGLDKSKGPVATFIVQKGTLKKRDIIVSGEAFVKVRALFDDDGKLVSEAGPSLPIQMECGCCKRPSRFFEASTSISKPASSVDPVFRSMTGEERGVEYDERLIFQAGLQGLSKTISMAAHILDFVVSLNDRSFTRFWSTSSEREKEDQHTYTIIFGIVLGILMVVIIPIYMISRGCCKRNTG